MIRFRAALPFAVVLMAVVLAGCGDDSGSGPSGSGAGTTTTTASEGGPGEQTFDTGEATLELAGEHHEFTLDFCGLQPADVDAASNVVTLQADGVAADGGGTTLSIVETVTHEVPSRIQVVTLRFEGDDGRLARAWEAQRVIDIDTGEVTDLHGEGTTPLLDVAEDGTGLVITVTDATFWQFDMTGGGDEGEVGNGTLRATCSVA